VRFLLALTEVLAPPLNQEVWVYYGWCSIYGEIGEDRVCHDCTKGAPWPECPFRLREMGECWHKFYVYSAGDQVIEKWRWIRKYQCWNRQESTGFELLWHSPSSNSVSFDSPSIPLYGCYCFGEPNSDRLIIGCQIILENGVMKHVGDEKKREEKLKRIVDSQIEAPVCFWCFSDFFANNLFSNEMDFLFICAILIL